jgi:flagellar basal-body rod protein FlgG
MMSALRIAATGMQAQQQNVDVLSNNISNLNTTGYKRQIAAFNDLVYQDRIGVGSLTSDAGTIAPTGAQMGLGVKLAAIYRVMEQGTMTQTGNTLDLAVQGRGFFRVAQPDGTDSYTRDGSFNLNENGQIVSKEGYLLDPSITIDPDATDVTISATGVVSGNVGGTITNFGTITVAMFVNEGGLRALGNNYFAETESSGGATDTDPTQDGSGSLLQGFLEFSNVDPINAVTDLITAQRAYELNSRVISTADEMLNAVNQIR